MFIVNIASMAQEQVFSIGTNGDIVTKNRADGYVPTKLMCRLICNLPELSIRIFQSACLLLLIYRYVFRIADPYIFCCRMAYPTEH